ncbi:MAG: ABC transporter substrate-binding protein [Burkholderiales bacterium]|nr:ABC transporter substrate-binding protein [Burkholderiales bacterium]
MTTRKVVTACAAVLAFHAYAGTNDTLVLYTENSAPNNYLAEDGKTVRGIATEKIEAAFKKAGIPYAINVTSWSRALNMAKMQANACVYSTAKLPERESSFQWVAPVAQSDWYLWGKVGSLKPVSLDEVRGGKAVCSLLGDAPGRFLLADGMKVVSSESHEICARNVLRGFADYWATSLLAGTAEVTRLGLQDQIVPLIQFHHQDLYLACNPAVPKATVEQMKAALQP